VKTEGSLPCSQQLATGPYSEPDESSPQPPTDFPKIQSNVILPSTPRSSEWTHLFSWWIFNELLTQVIYEYVKFDTAYIYLYCD